MVRFHPRSQKNFQNPFASWGFLLYNRGVGCFQLTFSMSEEEKDQDEWWRPAMFFYFKTTAWIVVPIGVGLLVNYLVRNLKPGWNNSLLFLSMVIAFIITAIGIYKEIKEYQHEIGDEDVEGE